MKRVARAVYFCSSYFCVHHTTLLIIRLHAKRYSVYDIAKLRLRGTHYLRRAVSTAAAIAQCAQ
jgi:hypothetical protein